jgi:hypothetical protein
VVVTRTSRAWSYPGYDDFIIFEYELQNTDTVAMSDMFVVFPYGFGPSMFGYERRYNRWGEGDYRSVDQFARYDLRRWMTYNHDRIGKPDSMYFDVWSTPGNRGGLNSPQAAGLVTLYYDYDHLALKGQTSIIVTPTDSVIVWDPNNRIKQPYLNRYENANLYPAKIQTWLDPAQDRRTGPFSRGGTDSTYFSYFTSPTGDPYYWKGRAKPSWTLSWSQPVAHGYGFGPYTLPAGQTMRFAFAEVVGYGAGVARDSIYSDLGGGIRNEPAPGLHPVPSWYKSLTYPNVGTPPVIGSDYLQTHPLPWYVDPDVVSIRDVADRAIQMYTGQPLVKYDSVQYEPIDSTRAFIKQRNGVGYYNTIPIPVPSPSISVFSGMDTVHGRVVNKISWGPQVESFSVPRVRAPFARYSVMKAPEPLGPWRQLDTVGRRDPRYFRDSVYVFNDDSAVGGQLYYYSVLSVDALGGRSGMTNMTMHETPTDVDETTSGSIPCRFTLEQNFPNPFNPSTTIRFALPKSGHVELKVYNTLGQVVATLVNEEKVAGTYAAEWNVGSVASGVYYYRLQAGEFTQTKKLILLR